MKRTIVLAIALALGLTACGPNAAVTDENKADTIQDLDWDGEVMKEVWNVTVDGSITDYNEVMEQYAQAVGENIKALPAENANAVQDVQNPQGRVSDAYTGQPENFYGTLEFYFQVEDGNATPWQTGSGMYPITEGDYAGYWDYAIGASFACNEDGDWVCTGTFTGGPILVYPTPLDEATVEQLVDYFFHTTGEFDHPYRIPLELRQRSAEQLAALNEILPQYPEADAKALCQTLGNHAKTYPDRTDVMGYDDLFALLDAPYRDWLSADVPTPGPEAKAAYEALLAGDMSLVVPEDLATWGLSNWPMLEELEYTYLDLDGDGEVELLLQWEDDPASYNGVFHYADGQIHCWQHDMVEASCRDYPLIDGTMVRQYDFSGNSSYTIFRYDAQGGETQLGSLSSQENDPQTGEYAPRYTVDDSAVGIRAHHAALAERVTGKLLPRTAWTPVNQK